MRRLLLVLPLIAAAPQALADTEFDITCVAACQEAFAGAVEDIGAALNYKALGPAEATGLTGIGIGVFANYTGVENDAAWRALTGEDVDFIGMAGIVAHKGLPFGLDVGAFYTAVPDTSVKAFGAELRYAILEGGIAEPALALRAAYTMTSGIDDFDYDAWSADVSLSKGFAFVTPYVGAGYVWATAEPSAEARATYGIRTSDADNERVFVGARLSLVFLELTPEFERIGDNNAYNLRLGFSF